MVAVQSVAGGLSTAEYEVFVAMLRLFLLLGIPSAGLQTSFAQQSAAALTPDLQGQLASQTRRVLGVILLMWLGMVALAVVGYDGIRSQLKLGDGRVLWPTLGLALLWLVAPVLRGILQGREDFGTLGGISILDGFLRFSGVLVAVPLLRSGPTGAMTAAFAAMTVSTLLAAWASRGVWLGPGAAFAWGPWIAKVLPFTLGAGALLTLAYFDQVYLKAMIPADRADEFLLGARYLPASMIGFALTQVTVPLAVVMFPKIARSAAGGEKTNALALALVGTAGIGILAVGLVTLFPALPLKILYFRHPQNWQAAPIVPWCASAMLVFALANVLVSNLLAQKRFRIVPWAVAVAVAFVTTLFLLQSRLLAMEPFAAFRLVAQVIGGFNLLLLSLAIVFTWGLTGKGPNSKLEVHSSKAPATEG